VEGASTHTSSPEWSDDATSRVTNVWLLNGKLGATTSCFIREIQCN